MEISQTEEKSLLLARIDPFIAELLRRVPASADPSGSEDARARIFSSPTEDPAEDEFTEDWQQFVEPELAKLFQSALQVIQRDLKKLRIDSANGEGTLSVAYDHLESWIHGLNQARLVLSERHQFSEEEMEKPPLRAADPRFFILAQMRLYADLQGIFLHALNAP